MHDLERPLKWAKVTCQYTNQKSIDDFLCIGNDNVCPICHRLRDIHSQNMHDLALDLYNE